MRFICNIQAYCNQSYQNHYFHLPLNEKLPSMSTLELKKTELLYEKTPAAGYLCERKNGLLIFQKLLLDTSTRYQILQEQQNK